LITRTNVLQNSLIAIYCRDPSCITPSDVSNELFIQLMESYPEFSLQLKRKIDEEFRE